MAGKTNYRTVFVSDIHLGHPKNQGDKLIKFLDSIDFENLIIVGDFIDYRQLRQFGKRTQKDSRTLNYINDLAKNGVNVTYLQGNHDRELKCSEKIKIENMTICRDMYYTTLKGKRYYVIHGDDMDGVNKDGGKLGQLGSIIFGLLLKIESLWNKKTFDNSYISFAERFEERIKNHRMPESKIKNKIRKFTKNLDCDGIIIGHFHIVKHSEINGLDYFNLGDWISNCSVVVEDKKGNLELVQCN